jgi:predicted short-subunit dehydrogenase-like oxidoreductase (DUF2520 family)
VDASPATSNTDRAEASVSVASVTGNRAAPLRIGILGAARIAPMALIRPAAASAEVEVAAVAARDASRGMPLPPNMGSPACTRTTRG